MSDRNVIATTVFIAGIMFGAFTLELKDQTSLHLGTLGFDAIMKCSATGPWSAAGLPAIDRHNTGRAF
jgi:hypothetical protein